MDYVSAERRSPKEGSKYNRGNWELGTGQSTRLGRAGLAEMSRERVQPKYNLSESLIFQ